MIQKPKTNWSIMWTYAPRWAHMAKTHPRSSNALCVIDFPIRPFKRNWLFFSGAYKFSCLLLLTFFHLTTVIKRNFGYYTLSSYQCQHCPASFFSNTFHFYCQFRQGWTHFKKYPFLLSTAFYALLEQLNEFCLYGLYQSLMHVALNIHRAITVTSSQRFYLPK